MRCDSVVVARYTMSADGYLPVDDVERSFWELVLPQELHRQLFVIVKFVNVNFIDALAAYRYGNDC